MCGLDLLDHDQAILRLDPNPRLPADLALEPAQLTRSGTGGLITRQRSVELLYSIK